MALFVFDSEGTVQRDIETGIDKRLPPPKPPMSDFVQVEFIQPPGTSDSRHAEQLLLHAIAAEALALLDNPKTT